MATALFLAVAEVDLSAAQPPAIRGRELQVLRRLRAPYRGDFQHVARGIEKKHRAGAPGKKLWRDFRNDQIVLCLGCADVQEVIHPAEQGNLPVAPRKLRDLALKIGIGRVQLGESLGDAKFQAGLFAPQFGVGIRCHGFKIPRVDE